MYRQKTISILMAVLFVASISLSGTAANAMILADHTTVSIFPTIPATVIHQVRDNYRIFYGHTSHGSQIVTGMGMLRDEDTLYSFNNGAGTLSLSEYGSDLGHYGDTNWVTVTRAALEQPGNTINMVMWSWCAGVSDNTVEGINIYLNAMNQLEQDYPNVTFIYMTGHLDGTGTGGNLYAGNNQIRAYCAAHNKILFDFADIESYDPDGNYYPNAADDCAWCSDWCSTHTCPDCGSCAHSHCFNCYQKGKAFWWMMARISGWSSGTPVCGDANSDGTINVSDAVYLISYVFGEGSAPNPISLGDCDCTGVVNVSDAVYLVSYIFGSGAAPCAGCK